MAVALEPFTSADIPSAITVHTPTLAFDHVERAATSLLSFEEVKQARTHEWTLALENPFAKIVKATKGGELIGAAGFLTHKANGIQWTRAAHRESAASIEKKTDDRLAEAREKMLKGNYDLWHVYLAFLSPTHRSTSTWSDMISWGLSQADKAGKRVYVEASATEKVMYEKLGFKVQKAVKLSVDGTEGESGDEYMRYLMLRPAKV